MKYLVLNDYEFPEGAVGEAMKKYMPDMVGSVNLSWRVGNSMVKWGNLRPEKIQNAIAELREKGHEFKVEDLRKQENGQDAEKIVCKSEDAA
jgi:hypothetical protein